MSTWMLPTYNARRWAYNEAPEAGDRVHYVNDKFTTTVQIVRWDRIVMRDGSTYRRRGNAGRIWAWMISHVRSSNSNSLPATVKTRPLRPAHYVHVVTL